MASASEPHLVDAHVGARLRALRKARGLSQSALAEAIGLTFQQVQKYEKGANRISASKLFEAAAIIGVSIEAFYEGLPTAATPERAPSRQRAIQLSTLDEGLVEATLRLGSMERATRNQLFGLIRAITDAGGQDRAA